MESYTKIIGFKSLLVVACCFFCTFATQAQTHFSIYGSLGIPANQFRDATTANAWGGGGNIFFPFDKRVPIFLGLDFNYMVYGIANNRQRINATITAGNQIIQTIPLDYQIRTTNNLLSGHLVLRFRIPTRQIQPYFDGYVGFKNFYTRTTVTDVSNNNNFFNNNNLPSNNNNNNNNRVLNSQTNLSDVAFSYGGGGGFLIGSGAIRLDIRCVYLLGETARFFDRSSSANWSINFSQNTNQFDSNVNLNSAKRSQTDMFYAQIGMVISF
jgi:hypothetical protein